MKDDNEFKNPQLPYYILKQDQNHFLLMITNIYINHIY